MTSRTDSTGDMSFKMKSRRKLMGYIVDQSDIRQPHMERIIAMRRGDRGGRLPTSPHDQSSGERRPWTLRNDQVTAKSKRP